MNTQASSTHRILALAAAAAATAAIGAMAFSSDEAQAQPSGPDVVVQSPTIEDIPRVEVRYGDLDLDSQRGRDRLTTRLDVAVRTVCGDANLRVIPEYSAMKSCRVSSTERAYADRDALFAEHMAARENGTTLAMADRSGSLGVTAVR